MKYPATIIQRADNSCQKIDKICPLAIQNQISIILMHMVKIDWYLLKLSSGNKNMDMWQADNCHNMKKFVH